ncbi:stage II sporulation protein R [Ornithinibacillus sp. 4-3]|uniref:Stage II sporulation protein R n=1 Tax=Ornithinibacillus sp. 4-3 TaxID=3231488 RepID=A0AB39HSB5_9BACI
MKKAFLFILLFLLFFMGLETKQATSFGYQVIPDEAIRLRILANSDADADQAIKYKVRNAVNAQVESWVGDMTDINEARELIQENISAIHETIAQVLETEGISYDFHVSYRKDIPFPNKFYGNLLYPAGEYEAILVTLGEGFGENWWCVLFPPLCFVDFNQEATVLEEDQEQESEAEVKFFLLEWLGFS